jgi:hypothetical protein
VVPDSVTVAIRCYLRQLDQVLPGVVSGFYLVGSVALGATGMVEAISTSSPFSVEVWEQPSCGACASITFAAVLPLAPGPFVTAGR